MITKVFSIYDTKSEIFSPPFFMLTNGAAIRAFRELANSSDNDIGKYPGDYRLMCLGSFNNESGEFDTTSEKMANLGYASDYVNIGAVTPIGVNSDKAVS